MRDVIFEPFGESLPAAALKKGVAADATDHSGRGLYRAAILAFWLIVAVIVVARVTFHGNIFAFGI